MVLKKRKTYILERLAIAAVFAAMLGACANPLADAAKSIQAEAASPRLVLTDPGATTVVAKGSLVFPDIIYGTSSDLALTFSNSGRKELTVGIPTLTMGASTEVNCFVWAVPPVGALSIAPGKSATMTLRFQPTGTVGPRSATCSFATNDIDNPNFTFTAKGNALVFAAPATPTGLAVNNALTGSPRIDCTSFDISWNAVPGATSYIVSRYSIGDILESTLPEITAGTSVRDTGLVLGSTHRYGVVAKNAAGISADTTHLGGVLTGTPSSSVTLNTTSNKILNLVSAYGYVGDSITVAATVLPAGASVKTVAWTSSNTSVATVDAAGNIVAIDSGTATITGSCQDNTGTSAGFTLKVLKIGVIGQVGYVFYKKDDYTGGWRYMEAAPSDMGPYSWGPDGSVSTGTGIGTGSQNTYNLCFAGGYGYPSAAYCFNATYGGKTGFFLPSKDELDLMFRNLASNGLGGPWTSFWYWSSSQANTYQAYLEKPDLTSSTYLKSSSYSVRAVWTY
jgi:hypothetical protein